MVVLHSLSRENKIIILILIVFSILSLILRLQTYNEVNGGVFPTVIFEDAWYNVHIIEQIIPNFPSYPWFDPMQAFPIGKVNNWGPVFPLAGAILAILFQGFSQENVIQVVSWLPPLLSLFMIPIVFSIGNRVWGMWAGLSAAFFVAFVSGEYLFRSMYGYLDHHIMETLLSTIFILIYILMIQGFSRISGVKSELKDKIVKYGFICGILYYLGIMNIPTMILFAIIISVFLGVFWVFSKEMILLQKICLANIVGFTLFVCLFAFTGIHHEGINLRDYSIGHVLLGLLLILGNAVLFFLARWKEEKNYKNIGILLLTCLVVAILALSGFIPTVGPMISGAAEGFFMAPSLSEGIEELGPMKLGLTIYIYNILIFLVIVGFSIILLNCLKRENSELLLILIWSLIIIGLSVHQSRYQYYAAIPACILGGIALSSLSARFCVIKGSHETNKTWYMPSHDAGIRLCKKGLTIILIFFIIFGLFSVFPTISAVTKDMTYESVNTDWIKSLLWLNNSTPHTGVDITHIYEKEGFVYPEGTYTVGSATDYGLYILGIGKRIPENTIMTNSNVHSYYLSNNPDQFDDYLAERKVRYFIADQNMIRSLENQGLSSNINTSPVLQLFTPLDSNSNRMVIAQRGLTDPFYQALITRLYIYDGSHMKEKERTPMYYSTIDFQGKIMPIVPKHPVKDISLGKEQPSLMGDIKMEMISNSYFRPTTNVPALTHFRLVYESPSTISNTTEAEVHQVKIFEHVKGHIIPGTGTIELPLVTNQGRNFTYRQQSVNNTFTLPYSTTNSPYDVHATGPYRIIETNETFEVDESQIEKYYI